MKEKYLDGLMGFVIGDAMGFPVLGKRREELLANPVTKMIENELYHQPAGTWSSLTSLLIATIDSVNVKNTFDYEDITLKFIAFKNHATYTPYNEVFSIEKTTSEAIELYEEETKESSSLTSLSNGSLLRILPVAYYCFENKMREEGIRSLTKEVSSLTHKNEVVIMGCYLFVRYILFLLNGKDKFSAYSMTKCVDYSMFSEKTVLLYNRILKEDISKLNVSAISSSSNIVDTLEAVLWVTLKAENYKESIIGAINLGGDSTSIGALSSSIAGIIYGNKAIPTEWKEAIVRKEYLLDIFEEFSENKYDS